MQRFGRELATVASRIEHGVEKEAPGNLQILTAVARIAVLVACTREDEFQVFIAANGLLRVDCPNVSSESSGYRLDDNRSWPNRLNCLVLHLANTQDVALNETFRLGRRSPKIDDRHWI